MSLPICITYRCFVDHLVHTILYESYEMVVTSGSTLNVRRLASEGMDHTYTFNEKETTLDLVMKVSFGQEAVDEFRDLVVMKIRAGSVP